MRGIVKAPGVNLLLPSDPTRRVRTLEGGSEVEVLDEGPWLRVAVEGVAGLVPAASIEVNVAPLAETQAESDDPAGLRVFAAEAFVGDPITAHVDFHPALGRLNDYAMSAEARIHVTHSFRRRGAQLKGAIVPPAKRSNHLVGHAIDMNIVLPGEWLNSERLRPEAAREWPGAARRLIEWIRQDAELRWGGDFVRPDPVHIDDDLYRRDPDAWMAKLAAV